MEFAVRMLLLGVMAYILKALALDGFFESLAGKVITIIFSVVVVGFAVRRWIVDRKRQHDPGEELIENMEVIESEISNRRFVITIVFFIAILICAIYMLVWLLDYGASERIMTVSEEIYLLICSLGVFHVCRVAIDPICCRLSRIKLKRCKESTGVM